MNKVVVIIPIYNDSLTDNELISLSRCFKILGSYDIVFVSPEFLDLRVYKEVAEKYNINFKTELFDNKYFTSTDTYNKLLLSYNFYFRFEQYDYMLIYQLDAYVFKDELMEWCKNGYDYIGAPLIGHYFDTTFSTSMRVGNGGFSLRKIRTFLDAFKFRKNLLSTKEIIKRNEVCKKPFTRLPLLFLMWFGYKNKFSFFANIWKFNEDDFWSGFLDNTNFSLNKPTPKIALEFSFERFPQSNFAIINKLPFGCHAWEKYEFQIFWKKYIEPDNN